ncbi:Hypothetical protein FKW44_024042 [Caligus rogercresseyi]|uniref:Uncharacterized protein n=1 Tax=Caligus rogercresseyi TaxID=217165 RepID=A0A7T8GQA8_CALRO|nr:Hypothetical protein FKW44_024042 [Caligus rogercresseyi]
MDNQVFQAFFEAFARPLGLSFDIPKDAYGQTHKTFNYIPSLLTLKNPCKPQNPLTDTNLF